MALSPKINNIEDWRESYDSPLLQLMRI